MSKGKKKIKLSFSTSSDEVSPTAYYRIYQYFDPNKYEIKYRPKMSGKMYSTLMPVSSKPLYIKVWVMIILYFRGLQKLLADVVWKPDVLVLSRGLLTRVTPLSYRLLMMCILWRGTKLIWDFDDNIIESKETSRSFFDWLSKKASRIVVASEFNRQMIRKEWCYKCLILPTTDKNLFYHYNNDLKTERLNLFKNEIRLIWLGTASGLGYLEQIVDGIEQYAEGMTSLNKKVCLTVVCNKPLDYIPKYFNLRFIKWSRELAVEEMKKSHIGLMPVIQSEFSKGKGGFKLIQYLSIGLPVIGSPVGINDMIITNDCGVKVNDFNPTNWADALKYITTSSNFYIQMSEAAFSRWKQDFSFEYNLREWENIVHESLNEYI